MNIEHWTGNNGSGSGGGGGGATRTDRQDKEDDDGDGGGGHGMTKVECSAVQWEECLAGGDTCGMASEGRAE